jgi:hypothetical protein
MIMSETEKKSPAEVWKLLPIKHKIISVVVAVVVASVGALGVYYAATGEVPKLGFGGLTPARDLTGTWRGSYLDQQGLVTWIQMEGGKQEFIYYDVELKLTQTGNTISGTLTTIPRKEEMRYLPGTYILPYSDTPVTGTVEITKIQFTSGSGELWKGTFTADLMSGTFVFPGEYLTHWEVHPEEGVPPPKIIQNPDLEGHFSLNRVW